MNQPFKQLLPYVRAIVGSPRDGVVEFIGSAFLCKDAEGIALITAAHVTDHLTDEYPLFVDRPDEGLVRIYGNINATKSNIKNRANDKIDIAVIRLNTEISKKLSNTPMLKPHQLDISNECDYSNGFVVVGFPVSKNKRNVKGSNILAMPYGICSNEAPDEKYSLLGVTKSEHIAIHLNKKEVFSEEKNKRNAISLIGLSGAPVWGITKEGKGKVVSVLTEHHQKNIKAILTTKINVLYRHQ